MGNWRRVQILGLCDAKEAPALELLLHAGFTSPIWGALHNGGICGLPNWADTEIAAVGNLGERDYSPQCVADAAVKLAQSIPSLALRIHCGADYEGDECIATVRLDLQQAIVGPPEIDTIPAVNQTQMLTNMAGQLLGKRRP